MHTSIARALLFFAALAAAPPLHADEPAAIARNVDRIVAEVLKQTGTPSASVAIVQGGRLVHARAYGDARVEPTKTAATVEMRYSIGSISKQFTAAAILLLVEQGKLTLDDPVARFLPGLTRGAEVKVRDLLAHTSGYQDYWPQDYVTEIMKRDVSADDILDMWAKKALDFDPGTQWQYSNTGYVAAALIVEKAGGQPYFEFLKQRVFVPLGMSTVIDLDRASPSEVDAAGYTRYAQSPLRAAPKEGKGWLFGAGALSMTPSDLAKWNIALLERRILQPTSYAVFQREVLLKNGVGTDYSLGLDVSLRGDHRALEHGGAVSGFLASNLLFPDDGAAITVLTNDDVGDAANAISAKLMPLLFERQDGKAASEARAKVVFTQLQKGKIDRALFSANANAYFTDTVLKDIAASTKALGAPTKVEQASQKLRGGMLFRQMMITCRKKTLTVRERDLPDGKIEQFLIMAH